MRSGTDLNYEYPQERHRSRKSVHKLVGLDTAAIEIWERCSAEACGMTQVLMSSMKTVRVKWLGVILIENSEDEVVPIS